MAEPSAEVDAPSAAAAATLAQPPPAPPTPTPLVGSSAFAAFALGEARPAALCAEQLERRVAHLEADLALLSRRKSELEHENEALAAAARQQGDLARRLQQVEGQLAAALAERDRLQEECERHQEESSRRFELELQQAAIASSFTELQGVVSQLVRRLGEMDRQRSRLAAEKSAAEAVADKLRAELARWTAHRQDGGGSLRAAAAARSAEVAALLGIAAARPLRPRAGESPRAHSALLPARARVRGRGRGGASPAKQQVRRQSPMATAELAGAQGAGGLQLADVVVQCELFQQQMATEELRQLLATEEQACAQARCGMEEMLSESNTAEFKRAELQSELREVLALWSSACSSDAPQCHGSQFMDLAAGDALTTSCRGEPRAGGGSCP